MTKEASTTIEIMGKAYQIKCPENEVHALQKAAHYLEEKMHELRTSGKVLSMDRIAVLVALNISHQYLSLESENNAAMDTIQARLQNLYSKLNNNAAEFPLMELQPAE